MNRKPYGKACSPGDFRAGRVGSDGGFTLLELVIVMVIIGITMGVILPRMPGISGLEMDRGARKLGMLIQLTRDRAVTLRRYYRLDFDLEKSVVTASYFGPEDRYIPDEDVKALTLPEKMKVLDLVTAGEGKKDVGMGEIHFSPRGIVEPSVIHVSGARDRMLSVLLEMLNGEVRLESGYVELSSP